MKINLQRSVVFILPALLSFYSCSKTTIADSDEVFDEKVDSSALLTFRWNYIKDSSTNIGDYYFMEGGAPYSPNPGVYTGVPGDFVHFKTDGTVDIHANNQDYHSTYFLHPGNKIVISDLLVHDTGRVVQLNATHAVLDWSNTSPNGGKYFRRMYLQH